MDRVNIFNLYEDIFFNVSKYLSLTDLIKLKSTCKHFHELIDSKIKISPNSSELRILFKFYFGKIEYPLNQYVYQNLPTILSVFKISTNPCPCKIRRIIVFWSSCGTTLSYCDKHYNMILSKQHTRWFNAQIIIKFKFLLIYSIDDVMNYIKRKHCYINYPTQTHVVINWKTFECVNCFTNEQVWKICQIVEHC